MKLLVQLFDAPECQAQGPHQLLSEYVTEGSDPDTVEADLTEAAYYDHTFDVGDRWFKVTAIAG